ncbi:MAG: hypothetical protein KF752_17055 [Pirellulaceae bacterium]|nr:hypothetical protein [Pirellulaceae bacterium]
MAEWTFLLNYLPYVATLAILVTIFVVAWFGNRSNLKRQQQFTQAATDLGLSYFEALSLDQVDSLSTFKLMNYGSSRLSSNVIRADTEQLSLTLFDYHYTSGSGKNRRTVRQTVAWVASPTLKLPEFRLSPEGLLDRLGDLLFKSDIDFQDDPEFSKRFLLTGPDQPAIGQFFDASRRRVLLNINLPTIEARPGAFIFYRPGQQVGPQDLKKLMSEAYCLYQAFGPSHAGEGTQVR